MAHQRGVQQLPPGRHGLPRDYVTENQRNRILKAVARTVADAGYGEMTVEKVVSRAGISRKTFYQYFGNKEEAFLAAYDAYAARVLAVVQDAQVHDAHFERQAGAIIQAVLNLFAEQQAEAYVVVVGALTASPRSRARRDAVLQSVTETVHGIACGLATDQGRSTPPRITSEIVVGGIAEVLHNRIHRGETAALPALLPDLVYCALLPYLGAEVAGAEHQRLVQMSQQGQVSRSSSAT